MPAPSITIDESAVGARAVSAAVLHTVGLVGHFNWGPVDAATLVTSLGEFTQKFGSTYEAGLTGMLSGYCAYAQSAAMGMYVVRISPAGQAAATLTLSAKVKIDALYPGSEGNNITVEETVGTDPTKKKFTIRDRAMGITEVFDNQFNTLTTNNSFDLPGGPNDPAGGSKLVRFTSLANTDPIAVAETPLAGGANGTPALGDYSGGVTGGGVRTGLHCFDPIYDVRFLLCAQQVDTSVQSALQTYVAGRGVSQGLVMGVTCPPINEDPATVSPGTLDSMRLGLFWPWVKSSAVPPAAQDDWIAPDGLIAGLLGTLPPNRSTVNKQLFSITDLQYQASDAQVDVLSDKRVNALTSSRGRGFRVRDGLTLSSDRAWSFWELRAEYDTVETTLWDAYSWVVGEPNIPTVLWPVVETQGDTVLSALQEDGTIVAYRHTRVVNTADDTAAGRLIIQHEVQFTVDVRFITLRIVRVLDATTS